MMEAWSTREFSSSGYDDEGGRAGGRGYGGLGAWVTARQ